MKLRYVADEPNKGTIEMVTRTGIKHHFPHDVMRPAPSTDNPIRCIYVDPELAYEGVTYFLADGSEGAVLLDHVRYLKEERAHRTRTRMRVGRGQKRRRRQSRKNHRFVS